MSRLFRRISTYLAIVVIVGFGLVNRPGATPVAAVGGSIPIQNLVNEAEPNDTPATANALASTDTVILGYGKPSDQDYYSFTANAGDRVYAATMTSSSTSSTDSTLTLLGSDGTTVIETDLDDGSLGTTSSSIAGALIPSSGTYYIRVSTVSTTSPINPYHLHLRVQSSAPTAETEPNDTNLTATALPATGLVTGTLGILGDLDFYSLALNAGDTVFASLDMNPERDGTTWNGRIGVGLFSNNILVVNDGSVISPNSEAIFITAQQAGTYYVYVDTTAGVGGPSITYNLSVSVHAAKQASNCTTYTSADVPKALGPSAGVITSTLSIPGNIRIEDILIGVNLNHQLMNDLDVTLTAPDGNVVGLFTDIGATVANTANLTTTNLTINDAAAIPLGSYTVLNGLVMQPEASYRTAWFNGQQAGGTWTLSLYDDTTNASGGTLTSWNITICAAASTALCAVGYNPVTLFSSDFEASDGGFTHSGTADTWAWGVPIAAPINTAASGSNVWKTNLSGTYSFSSVSNLVSPPIDLTGITGPIVVQWGQKYQMESAQFDHMIVDIGDTTVLTQTLFEYQAPTMTTPVGNPGVTLNEAAGWSVQTRDVSALAGKTVRLRFHVDTDTTVQLAGLAVDDVSVTACVLPPTATATATETATDTATATATATETATATSTATETATETATATATATDTGVPAATATDTATATATDTGVPAATATDTATATATDVPVTATATATTGVAATATATRTATATVTRTATATTTTAAPKKNYLPIVVK